MTLLVGTPMIRVDDGMRGVVEVTSLPGDERFTGSERLTEPRVVYYDRGERRVAGKLEKWEPEEAPPTRMRPEEMRLVALAADRLLESIDKHEPDRYWEPLTSRRSIHDPGLFQVITDYLRTRA